MRLDEIETTLVDQLKDDCSEYLTTISTIHTPFIRGIRKFDQDTYINVSPRNRRRYIGDDFLWIEVCIDRYLKKVGIEALRTNSTFVHSSISLSEQYGELYIVFPKNGFKFCYGGLDNRTSDIYNVIGDWLPYAADCAHEEWGYSKRLTSFIYDCHSSVDIFACYLQRSAKMRSLFETHFLSQYGFTDKNLITGITTEREIWFTGNYHLIKLHSNIGDDIIKTFNLKL